MDTKLSIIDLDAQSAPLESVVAEVKEIGSLQIESYKTGDFRADITGQKGTFSYQVKGKSRTYNLGADAVVKLSMATGFKPMIADDKLSSFIVSEHFTKLRSAQRRQLQKLAKKRG